MNMPHAGSLIYDAPLTATRTSWKRILSSSWGASGAFDDAFDDDDGDVDADAWKHTWSNTTKVSLASVKC